MKKFILAITAMLVLLSCSTEENKEKKIIGSGNFTFTDIKGSYQLYTEGDNIDNIFGYTTYISDDGISTEVELKGTVNADGTFTITETVARNSVGESTDVTITGSMTAGELAVNSIMNENNEYAAYVFENDPTAIIINSKGYELWKKTPSEAYEDSTGTLDPPSTLDNNFEAYEWNQNYSSVATIIPADGEAVLIAVYQYTVTDDFGNVVKDSEGNDVIGYDYIKQIGTYVDSTEDGIHNGIITVTDANIYTETEMDEGVDSDGDGIADCHKMHYVFADYGFDNITAEMSDDGKSLNMSPFWQGRTWNKTEGTVIYSNLE